MKKVIESFREVLFRPAYILIVVLVGVAILLVTIWLPNHEYLTYTIFSHSFSAIEKARILMYSLGAFVTNFTMVSRMLTVVIAVLAGMNIAFLVYYFKKRAGLQKAAGTSLVGVISGFLGIGCSACGSVVLSSIFGITAATGFIGVLPMRGLEFSIISVVILAASTYYVATKIQSPLKCKLKDM